MAESIHGFAYGFDPNTLREVVADPAGLAAWLDAALRSPGADPYRHHTEVGVVARILGRLPLAEEHLSAAARLVPSATSRIRLAHVWHWQGRFAEAAASLRSCLVELPPERAHFGHQHLGKCLFDAGDLEGAREQFRMALELRIAAGAGPELLDSTRLAITAVERRLGG